jgi:sterol 3beta-glucosyltransferase
MKISLLTLGTRGDVQPYAALGKALKDSGHEVVLSTGKNFESLAKEYELNFLPVEADFQALINSEEGKAMMKNPFLARKHFVNIVQPMMVRAMRIFYEVSKESDCVLYHVKSLAEFFTDQFPKKMMRANIIPAIQPTREFPNPVFSALPLPRMLNRFTYKLADLGLTMMHKAIREFRVTAGLDPKFPKNLDLPSIYGISPHFLPRPMDFPSNSYFTGFWHGDSMQVLDPDIVDFLSSGNLNVLVTFGSMPFEAKFDLQKSIINLSKDLKVNIIVVKGWGFKNVAGFSGIKSIKVVENTPFDKLIPRVSAVVHHGGIGTIAECLRAGVPFLSCPVIYPMGDQYFWGKQAYSMGCSSEPIPLTKLKEHILNQKVFELLTSQKINNNSQLLAGQLSFERGLQNAVDIVETHFNAET